MASQVPLPDLGVWRAAVDETGADEEWLVLPLEVQGGDGFIFQTEPCKLFDWQETEKHTRSIPRVVKVCQAKSAAQKDGPGVQLYLPQEIID